MADFVLHDVPGRASLPIAAADLDAAKAATELKLATPANCQREWKPCGSGALLAVKSARGALLGTYFLRSA